MHPTRYVIDRTHGLRNLETLHDNVFWGGAEPRISICVPTLRHDVTPLLEGLAQCEAREAIEIIVYDDGSRDHDLLARMQGSNAQAEIVAPCIIAAQRIARFHQGQQITGQRALAAFGTHQRSSEAWMGSGCEQVPTQSRDGIVRIQRT